MTAEAQKRVSVDDLRREQQKIESDIAHASARAEVERAFRNVEGEGKDNPFDGWEKRLNQAQAALQRVTGEIQAEEQRSRDEELIGRMHAYLDARTSLEECMWEVAAAEARVRELEGETLIKDWNATRYGLAGADGQRWTSFHNYIESLTTRPITLHETQPAPRYNKQQLEGVIHDYAVAKATLRTKRDQLVQVQARVDELRRSSVAFRDL